MPGRLKVSPKNRLLFRRILLVCFVASFTAGIAIGYLFLKNAHTAKTDNVVKLLAFEGVFSKELIKSIENDQDIQIQIETASDIAELEEKFRDEKNKFDLATIYSFETPVLDEEARIQAINWSILKNKSNISPDFMNIVGDDISKKVMPIAWGLNGVLYNTKKFNQPPASWAEIVAHATAKERISIYDIPISIFHLGQLIQAQSSQPKKKEAEVSLKPLLDSVLKIATIRKFGMPLDKPDDSFVAIEVSELDAQKLDPSTNFKFILPNEGAFMWTLNIVQSRFASHPRPIAQFLDSVLEKDHALKLLANTHMASTNMLVEKESIAQKQKPSSLRSIPLRLASFQIMFPESELFSDLLTHLDKTQHK